MCSPDGVRDRHRLPQRLLVLAADQRGLGAEHPQVEVVAPRGQHLVEQGVRADVVTQPQREHRCEDLHRPRVGRGERVGGQQGGRALVVTGEQAQPDALPAAGVRPGLGEQCPRRRLPGVPGAGERRVLADVALEDRRAPLRAGPQGGLGVGGVVRVGAGSGPQVGEDAERHRLVGEQDADPQDRAPQLRGKAGVVHLHRLAQVVPGLAVAALLRGQPVGQQPVDVPPVLEGVRGEAGRRPARGLRRASLDDGDGAQAGLLGLCEAADVGHRLDPARPVLDVEVGDAVAPPGVELVEQ